MKIKIISYCFLVVCLLPSHLLLSQAAVGLRIGGSLSNYRTTERWENYELRPLPGLNAAMSFELPLWGRLSLQTELGFGQRGSRLRAESTANGHNIDFEVDQRNAAGQLERLVIKGYADFEERINYLDLPVLLKYRLRGRNLSAYLSTGINFAQAVGQGKASADFKLDERNSDLKGSSRAQQNFRDFLYEDLGFQYEIPFNLGNQGVAVTKVNQPPNNFPHHTAAQLLYPFEGSAPLSDRDNIYFNRDISLLLGAGVTWPMGDIAYCTLDLRYARGLQALNFYRAERYDHFNQSLQLSVGMAFELGGGGWR